MNKPLFTEQGFSNKDAKKFSDEYSDAVYPIFKKYFLEMGFNPRELELLMHSSIGLIVSFEVAKNAFLTKEGDKNE